MLPNDDQTVGDRKERASSHTCQQFTVNRTGNFVWLIVPSGLNVSLSHDPVAPHALQVTILVLTFVLTAALVALMGWHVYLVINNKTTIEYHEVST